MRLALTILALLVLSTSAAARPPHKKAVADHFGKFLTKKLNDCVLCHMPDQPGHKEEDGKEHNAFGARQAAIKKELSKAGKKTHIVSRLEAIAAEDADGDGIANLMEILSGRFPGDAKDSPTPAEKDQLPKTLLAYQ